MALDLTPFGRGWSAATDRVRTDRFQMPHSRFQIAESSAGIWHPGIRNGHGPRPAAGRPSSPGRRGLPTSPLARTIEPLWNLGWTRDGTAVTTRARRRGAGTTRPRITAMPEVPLYPLDFE